MMKHEIIKREYKKCKVNEYEVTYKLSAFINNEEENDMPEKSTSIYILANINNFEYKIDDTLVKNLNDKKIMYIRDSKIGIVMQGFTLVDDSSCIENVMRPFSFAYERKSNKQELAIKYTGLEDVVEMPINRLSCEQKQRIAIARAIVNEPSIIFAAKTKTTLDSKTAAEIIALFHKLNEKVHSLIIVTHDLELAKQCGEVVEIPDGEIMK